MVNYSPQQLNNMFHAMADPTRREIVKNLAGSPLPIKKIAQPHNMSLPAVSKHIKVLEKADIIVRKKSGRQNIISLNTQSLKEMSRYLSFYQDFWNDKFESLENYLEKRSQTLKKVSSKSQNSK